MGIIRYVGTYGFMCREGGKDTNCSVKQVFYKIKRKLTFHIELIIVRL